MGELKAVRPDQPGIAVGAVHEFRAEARTDVALVSRQIGDLPVPSRWAWSLRIRIAKLFSKPKGSRQTTWSRSFVPFALAREPPGDQSERVP